MAAWLRAWSWHCCPDTLCSWECKGNTFILQSTSRGRDRDRESPSLSWACSRAEQQEWGFPAVEHPLGFAA